MPRSELLQRRESDLRRALELAWSVRSNAYLIGKTAVGAVAIAEDGTMFPGCNIEHRYRSHDIHAEVSAISSMVATGHQRLIAIVVAAERERFTPCGGCMDWIFQFGGPECEVTYQGQRNGPITSHSAHDLMPYYPK